MIATPTIFEHRVLLHGVSWDTYQSLRADDENYHLRMTYDRGVLEIMSPSQKHERISHLLGRMIDQWTLERDVEIVAGRNTTFSRKDLDRGLEPDNCYWISNELAMREKDEVDLAIDPSPDLVIEVDISRSSVKKLPIYAALRVPEVWHWQFESLQVLTLNARGQYQIRKGSTELRGFPIVAANALILDREKHSDTALIRRFIHSLKSRR